MTTNESAQQYPGLARPPIAEVVCGVIFDSIQELDPLMLGTYWDARKTEYPRRSLQPAITDTLSFAVGGLAMRAVLVSGDDQFVLQLQHDRFFMNWRAKGGTYPRFSGQNGLMERSLAEYEKFSQFVHSRLNVRPNARKVELNKVDLLAKGQYWNEVSELADLLPITGAFSDILHSESREVNLRFVERDNEDVSHVHVSTLMNESGPTSVRIEARRTAAPDPDLASAFKNANAALNGIFFKLVPKAATYFGTKEAE